MKDELILVDENDFEIGFREKMKCHLGRGILHRAFSVFIFNSKGELLIQKRANKKMLWDGFWSNSCCSHPRRGEDIENAASRRIVEELGIACSLKFIYKFKYSAKFFQKNDSDKPILVGSEREFCSVFFGICDDDPVTDYNEISEFKWISIDDLFYDMKKEFNKYTPWFKLELLELRQKRLI